MSDREFTCEPAKLVAGLKRLRRTRATRKEAAEGGRRRRSLTTNQRALVLAKTGGRCHVCGGTVDEEAWQADHVLAFSGGGGHDAENYLAAHRLCNNYRWDYEAEEFQTILKLGVWARTQIERETTVGQAIAHGFTASERRRSSRVAVRR